MILAAGLGTRLRPLTFCRPKVLVPVLGATMLEFWLGRLHEAGFDGVVVNAYHLAAELVDYVASRPWPMRVEVRSEPILLGTGGGIRNVLDFFQGEPFLVVNGDVLSNAPLKDLYHRHVKLGRSVSMLMHHWPAFNNVAVDPDGGILAFGREAKDLLEARSRLSLLAYTGIQVINPEILEDLPAGQPSEILDTYRSRIVRGDQPVALFEPALYWREMGSLTGYLDLNRELSSAPGSFLSPVPTGKRIVIHERARVGPDVRLKGLVVVGKGSVVMEGAELEDSILWDGVQVGKGARLKNCVVADGVRVAGAHEWKIMVKGHPEAVSAPAVHTAGPVGRFPEGQRAGSTP
jgi:NDP-sugar pyrophosphorylase family protein